MECTTVPHSPFTTHHSPLPQQLHPFSFLRKIRAVPIPFTGNTASRRTDFFTSGIINIIKEITTGHRHQVNRFPVVQIGLHFLWHQGWVILCQAVNNLTNHRRHRIGDYRIGIYFFLAGDSRDFRLFFTTIRGGHEGKTEQQEQVFHIIGLKMVKVYLQFRRISQRAYRKSKVLEKSNFVDQIRIFCRSGHGGAGNKHFMRNKFTALGGPDGGDGGRGAHIILRGNSNLWTLLHLRYYKNVLAEDGERGGANNCHGRDGKDIIIEVPLGTIARDEETDTQEAEILEDGQEIIWMPGGKGGLGNSHFATPTNQAPEHAQPGLPGLEGWKVLELKVLADVGLVGFPNAGKSTLLSVITAAKPKIANYAFTTLTPNLGMVEYRDGKSFCIADLPGIIEGAAEGKGLGHRFLRHIERNSVLLFLVPADSDDHKKEFDILVNELEQYNPELLHKQFIIAVSKSDMLDDELKLAISKELPENIPHVFISSVTNKGLTELKDLLWNVLNQPVE